MVNHRLKILTQCFEGCSYRLNYLLTPSEDNSKTLISFLEQTVKKITPKSRKCVSLLEEELNRKVRITDKVERIRELIQQVSEDTPESFKPVTTKQRSPEFQDLLVKLEGLEKLKRRAEDLKVIAERVSTMRISLAEAEEEVARKTLIKEEVKQTALANQQARKAIQTNIRAIQTDNAKIFRLIVGLTLRIESAKAKTVDLEARGRDYECMTKLTLDRIAEYKALCKGPKSKASLRRN